MHIQGLQVDPLRASRAHISATCTKYRAADCGLGLGDTVTEEEKAAAKRADKAARQRAWRRKHSERRAEAVHLDDIEVATADALAWWLYLMYPHTLEHPCPEAGGFGPPGRPAALRWMLYRARHRRRMALPPTEWLGSRTEYFFANRLKHLAAQLWKREASWRRARHRRGRRNQPTAPSVPWLVDPAFKEVLIATPCTHTRTFEACRRERQLVSQASAGGIVTDKSPSPAGADEGGE